MDTPLDGTSARHSVRLSPAQGGWGLAHWSTAAPLQPCQRPQEPATVKTESRVVPGFGQDPPGEPARREARGQQKIGLGTPPDCSFLLSWISRGAALCRTLPGLPPACLAACARGSHGTTAGDAAKDGTSLVPASCTHDVSFWGPVGGRPQSVSSNEDIQRASADHTFLLSWRRACSPTPRCFE